MEQPHPTGIYVSMVAAVLLAAAGMWVGLGGQGLGGRTIAAALMLTTATAWAVRVRRTDLRRASRRTNLRS